MADLANPMATDKATIGETGPAPRKKAIRERRASRRCQIVQLMRLQPSDPGQQDFVDLRKSVSFAPGGLYFHTSEVSYEIGMRLFVTTPYSPAGATRGRNYVADVVRKDVLPNGLFGIGLKILSEIAVSHSYSFDAPGVSS
jgi:hypothetical protein